MGKHRGDFRHAVPLALPLLISFHCLPLVGHRIPLPSQHFRKDCFEGGSKKKIIWDKSERRCQVITIRRFREPPERNEVQA